MTIVDKSDATESLGEYAGKLADGVVIVTSDGRPVAALVPIENTDLETASLSTNPAFIELIQRSRSSVRDQGGISSEEMRQRFK